MSNTNILSLLTHVPALLRDAKLLDIDVAGLVTDPIVVLELAANPALAKVITDIASEWRTAESDAISVQKSNLFTVLPRLGHLLTHLQTLEGTFTAEQKNAQLLFELSQSPATMARLTAISAQWRKIESDVA